MVHLDDVVLKIRAVGKRRAQTKKTGRRPMVSIGRSRRVPHAYRRFNVFRKETEAFRGRVCA